LVGHSPQRHGGHVDNSLLHDRSVLGVDPASGTTIDAFTGKTHKVPRTATSFASDNALVFAEDYVRSSAEFTAKAASPSAGDVIKLNTPLQDIFGTGYQQNVRGITRIGSVKNPTGVEFTDFTGGTVRTTYVYENNKWNLITMFPEPKK
jgi:hypothetical protein